jgi:hypothetical protein
MNTQSKLSANDRFEIEAEVFRLTMGMMAPGKDCAPACPDNREARMEAWRDFRKVYGEVVRTTIDATEENINGWESEI